MRQPYPSDLTDHQWEVYGALMPAAKPGGRPRTADMREIVNAIFYVMRTGCAWRMLPHDFPRWDLVYKYFALCIKNELVNDVLIVPGMLSCVDAIVEHPDIVVRHHIVDETDVYVLPLAVGIAQARIDSLRCDLRLADATSMLTELIRECLRTSIDQRSKTDEPKRSRQS